MKQKTITIEHPLGHLTLVPRRPVSHYICKKTIRSIEGVLNAALVLTEETQDHPHVTKIMCTVDESDLSSSADFKDEE